MNHGDERLGAAFWSKVATEPNSGCWLWTAALSSTAHPVVRIGGETRYALHVAFGAARGGIPTDAELHRSCGVLCCVNPDHAQATTRRAWNRTKPPRRCKKGHEFTAENTYVRYGGGRMCKACQKVRTVPGKKRNPESARRARLWQRFGLTPESFAAMLEAQKGSCAICETAFGKVTPHVDHDHATGRVRGLLCMHCNNALGAMRDNPRRLLRAIAYLEAAP